MAIIIKSNDPNVPDKVLKEHEKVLPLATYSPWNKDIDFLRVMQMILSFTLVDIYRCYELWTLVEQSAKLGHGDVIEIGVWKGGTGVLIGQKAKLCNIPCKIYLCDTFKGVVKAGSLDVAYKGGEHADTSREIVEGLIQNAGLDNIKILEGVFPDETGDAVQDAKFRLCHIDVDVYQSAHDIVNWIWDRMVPGGIIVYDDYGFPTCSGVTRHVEEQIPLKDRLVFQNLNGHAVIVKL